MEDSAVSKIRKVRILDDPELFDSAKVVFDTRTDNEEKDQWLSQRTNSIGGSEIGSIAGYSKYGSALTTFNEKLGLVKRFSGNIHTVFGNRMEPHIREWVMDDFKRVTGISLQTYEYPFMMVDKEIEYFSANIDGIGEVEERYIYWENRDTGEIKYIEAGELFGLEIKTAGEFLKKMWDGEEIPDSYYIQCQWYMGITGLKYFLIVYLLGKEVKWKVIPRNEDDIEALKEIGKEFWNNHILTKVPPSPTGLKKETDEILEQQSLDHDTEIDISNNKLTEYNDISDKIKELEKEKERLKQEIFLDMGNSKKGTDGNYKISRFNVKRENIDSKLLKEKYPVTYETVLKGTTEFVNVRVSKVK